MPIVSDLKIQASIGMDALEKKNDASIINKKKSKKYQPKNMKHKKDIDKENKNMKIRNNMKE